MKLLNAMAVATGHSTGSYTHSQQEPVRKSNMALEVKEDNYVIFQEKVGEYMHIYTLKNIPCYFFHYFGFLASILLI